MGASALEPRGDSVGRRRRLLVIVAIVVVTAAGFGLMTAYADHRVKVEDARVRRAAADVVISDAQLLDLAYGTSAAVSQGFGVAAERVEITMGGGLDDACVTVRSEYLVSNRVSSFRVQQGGALDSVADC